MKFLTPVLVVIMTMCAAPKASAEQARAPLGPRIHVLLEKDIPSALVEAKGRYKVVRGDTFEKLSTGYTGKRFTMVGLQQGLRWGEEYPDIYYIKLIPMTKETTFSVNGIQYIGAISVYQSKDNSLTIVNELPIEEYLKSTLAIQHEDQSLAPEALAALAIVARTDAYNAVLNRSNLPWDIVANETGYFGTGVAMREHVDSAVETTRYMVLESLKEKSPLNQPHLSTTKADELAQKGMDAQKILKAAFPAAKISATISADEVAIR